MVFPAASATFCKTPPVVLIKELKAAKFCGVKLCGSALDGLPGLVTYLMYDIDTVVFKSDEESYDTGIEEILRGKLLTNLYSNEPR